MIITEISVQKKRDDRYNLYTDEGFLLSLSDETIIKNGIKKGDDLSPELLEELRAQDTLKFAKELAASYVSRGLKTRDQVITHLKNKGIDDISAGEAADKLEEYGFINDEEYAREFARAQSQKHGEKVIEQKLLLKGISKELAKKYSRENKAIQDDAAKRIAEKYRAKYAHLSEYQQKQKVYAALIRNGFSYDEAASAAKHDDFDD